MSLRSFFISAILYFVTAFSAHADPYRMWADEVNKATKGLSICREAYSKAIGYGRSEAEMKRHLTQAVGTCSVLKTHFDTTMLAVKLNVNGMDEALDAYQQLVKAAFERLTPKKPPDPLTYYTESLETVLTTEKMHLKLISVDGGR